MIILSIFVIQGAGHKGETGEASNGSEVESGRQERQLECCPCSGEHTDLKTRLCGPPAERTECKLCPANWVPGKERCYWFSEGTKTWLDSQADCSKRGGNFLVIQDKEEMRNIQGEYRFWIGLHIAPQSKNWSWTDGSLYNQNLFGGSFSKAGNSCAVVQVSQIRSEMCSDEFKWICEMETILL
ncbi:hypothetical protein lerEdw1_003215 [Lerista edwardsae]|nr:hypothetical protein lerEdw1_003215 [Lerista edwardsae]